MGLTAILAFLKLILKLEKVFRSSEKLEKKGVKLEYNRHLVTEKENRERIRGTTPLPTLLLHVWFSRPNIE